MPAIDSKDIHKIIVACDAGMGSSVMLATQLRKQLKSAGIGVAHAPLNEIPADADVVRRHAGLEARARGHRAREGAGSVPDLPRRSGGRHPARHDQEGRHGRWLTSSIAVPYA